MQKLGPNQLTYDTLITQLNTTTPLHDGSRTRHPAKDTSAKSTQISYSQPQALDCLSHKQLQTHRLLKQDFLNSQMPESVVPLRQ